MKPAYRADQVGSLLRPPEVLDARKRHAQSQLDEPDLRAIEDAAILQALDMQRATGTDVVTDGEYRRGSWQSDMADAVDGFVPFSTQIQWLGPGAAVEGSTAPIVGDKLRQRRRLTAHESSFLKAHAPGPWKITMPPPSVFLLKCYRPGVTDRAYATRQDMLADLVDIVGGEVRALVTEGTPYVQFDSPEYGRLLDERTLHELEELGLTADKALEVAIAGDNACLPDGRPDGATFALHICRGNSRSRWMSEGAYDPIAEQLFTTMNVDRFLLEYDSARAGGFEPLRFVPDDKVVVLGLITTKQGQLEDAAQLARRIDEAARYHSLDMLALSPQCGFASVSAGNLLSMDDQRRKLELVVKVARQVWG